MHKEAKRILSAYEINLLIRSNLDLSIVGKYPIDYPVEYITNKAIFKEIEFYVDENVLIPRIETEKIIDLAIARINAKNKIKFADIGTGSGCIGITLSQYLTKLNIQHKGFLSDIDNQAVKIARINAKDILGKQNNLKTVSYTHLTLPTTERG